MTINVQKKKSILKTQRNERKTKFPEKSNQKQSQREAYSVHEEKDGAGT